MTTIIEKCDIHISVDGNHIVPSCEAVEIEFEDNKVTAIRLYLDKRVELSTALKIAAKCRMTYRANTHALYAYKNIEIHELVCRPM